jgi:hypothetical protein
MTAITVRKMAQGARTLDIAWRHRETIRMGLAPKRRVLEEFASRWHTASGRSRPAMWNKRCVRTVGADGNLGRVVSLLTSLKLYCCDQTIRLKVAPEVESRLHPRGQSWRPSLHDASTNPFPKNTKIISGLMQARKPFKLATT